MKLPRPAFRSLTLLLLLLGALAPVAVPFAAAQEPAQAAAPEHRPGGEVNIRLPDLNQGDFLGFTGHEILLSGPRWSACWACSSASGATPGSRTCRCTARWRRSPS